MHHGKHIFQRSWRTQLELEAFYILHMLKCIQYTLDGTVSHNAKRSILPNIYSNYYN